MTTFEFETPIYGYNASPFLIEYLIDSTDKKPVLDQVSYDSLVLSIPDLPIPVQQHIHGAINSNLEGQVLYAKELFWKNIQMLAQHRNVYGLGAAEKLKEKETLSGQGIRQILNDMRKAISENPKEMQGQLGDTFLYFNNAKFIFD